MNRNRFLSITAAAIAAPILVFAADEALPKAETILERYIEVTGGRKAYEKHKTEHATMTMEFVGKGIKGTGTRYADSNNNTIESITLEGVGKIDQGITNGVAWESNPVTGPRVVTGTEKADRLRDARFNGLLYWKELWKSAETTGVENVEGEDCYKVVLTPAEGKPETNFFSKKTGLLIKKARVVTSPMGEIPVEVLTKDYKEYDGVKMPSRVSQRMMGNEIAVTADSVKFDVPIPAGAFEPPAEVKKLMAT
jgi:hypothetical protein